MAFTLSETVELARWWWTFIIRGVLAIAAVAILGRWNWWLPDWAARILRGQRSPAQPDAAPKPAPQPA